MGYDLHRFANEVDHEFVCPICHDVLKNAVEATKCQHIFCDECIKTWLQNYKKCPIDQKRLTNRELKPITRSLRNLLLKLRIKCDFVSEGCESVITLDALDYHVKQCEFNPHVIVKCDKGCDLQFTRREYNTHNCVRKLVDLVANQRKRIHFLENLFRDSHDRFGWHISNGLLYATNYIIRSNSFGAQIMQNSCPLNTYTYIHVKIVELGESGDYLRVGLFDSYLAFDNIKTTEENSIINYRSNGAIHLRQDNRISADLLGDDWNVGDRIECGIKAANPVETNNEVVVFFKHNNKLVTEVKVKYDEKRFYPTIYMWSMGAKVRPMIRTRRTNTGTIRRYDPPNVPPKRRRNR